MKRSRFDGLTPREYHQQSDETMELTKVDPMDDRVEPRCEQVIDACIKNGYGAEIAVLETKQALLNRGVASTVDRGFKDGHHG